MRIWVVPHFESVVNGFAIRIHVPVSHSPRVWVFHLSDFDRMNSLYKTGREDEVTKLFIPAILATAVLLSFACATGEVANPKDYILEDAIEVISTNYKVQPTSDVFPLPLLGLRSLNNVEAYIAAKKYGRDSVQPDSALEEIGRVEQVISVSAGGGTYYLVSGDFDFVKIEDSLRKESYIPREDWHKKDIYLWSGISQMQGDENVILFLTVAFSSTAAAGRLRHSWRPWRRVWASWMARPSSENCWIGPTQAASHR